MKNQPTMDEVMATMSLKDRLSLRAQFGAAFGQFYVPETKPDNPTSGSSLPEEREISESDPSKMAAHTEGFKEASEKSWMEAERKSAIMTPSPKPKQQPYNIGSNKLKKQLALEKAEKKRLLRQQKQFVA